MPSVIRKPSNFRSMFAVGLFVTFGLLATSFAQDEQNGGTKVGDTKPMKVSDFAPVKETESQLDYFAKKIGKDLDTKEDYGEAEQKRVGLDASTVSVLALTLGMHDKENKFKAGAAKLVEIANELAENSDDYDAAKEAHAALMAALKTPPKSDEELSWDEPVADLAMLMQQVPIINDGVRRAVNDKRRFKRNAKRSAARAVTLAAISHAAMMDTNYCSDEDDEKVWKKICGEMRDSSVDVYKALMKTDQDSAKEASARVVATCTPCHDQFK